jgi:hypothetical protein
MATCDKGMAFDREKTGFDQVTARNPNRRFGLENGRSE